MNREGAPGKSPEEMYIQQKVRVLLMLRKMGSNLTPSEEEFLRTYAGVVSSQLSQLPQHSIDQASSPCPRLQPRARGPSSSNSFALVCRCRGCGDGVFQVGDGGPEAVAANPLEYPGGWQRPGDLCGPHRLSGRGSPSLPRPPHPTPSRPAPRPLRILQGDTSGAVTIGLKGRTHDWLREETFLFLNLDQRKPFYF
ncbi:beta-catenin-interacting protein 1 isoform X1 [Orcinus orca]|uniref:beta-catenin-interacting protein 1 isoform X1 n=1 Tax=Orcinus orca TaxID=9733 RepID=UPI0021117AF8|nr:beta-catenin-interacting protein 1 isoform X1 [Orcinus orca]XP_049568770.1 beta-catenin-interacting protein 1 isoform X1 [Orcinus orca]XP_049568771.1 beta-catenin-interacting protein 1 isoform X1 [Orcinus orca]XP_049568772.1 beta-catenin-interacting protein 1 isoform X1 [Orcinus orca]XP_049568773.1 beta-catenin-interacting protein 1 isoform X1 [Orcinus orca]XP_049568774.1 beta-catenin-interacting protein 1 isoform X1 [Orcinus orca]